MSEEEIRKAVFLLLKRTAPDTDPEALQNEDDIRQSLDIDSFDYLQFIVALDEKFGIETPEEDYGKIRTLKNLVGYLLRKIQG